MEANFTLRNVGNNELEIIWMESVVAWFQVIIQEFSWRAEENRRIYL
jgi:hypothetical protein